MQQSLGNFTLSTVVGDNINIMKTTFELNFDFYQALKQHFTHKHGNKEKLHYIDIIAYHRKKNLSREPLDN